MVVLVVRRLVLARHERQRRSAEQRLHGAALALLDGEEQEVAAADEAVFAALVSRLSRNLRGDARRRAADYLEGSGYVDAELRALVGRRAWRRARGAYRLGEMGADRAVPMLRSRVSDRDRAVRTAAVAALGKLGAEEAVGEVAAALARSSVPRLIGANALLAMGDAALPELLRLVDAPDAGFRATAVELVGLVGSGAEAETVAARLHDTSGDVRARAATALGRLGAADASDALSETLDDRLPYVRAAAAEALGALGESASVSRLLRLTVEDEFEPARAAAAAAVRLDPARAERLSAMTRAPHILEAVARAAL